MQMNVRLELLIPGMQCGENSDTSSQVLGIGQELGQRLGGGSKEDVCQLGTVESPEDIELMREGKDDVMMRTGQQSLFPAVEPLSFGKPSALRAAAVPTGVVGNLMEVAVGATVDMPPELASATVLNRPCRPVHVRGEPMFRCVGSKVLLKEGLKRDRHGDLFKTFSQTSPTGQSNDSGNGAAAKKL